LSCRALKGAEDFGGVGALNLRCRDFWSFVVLFFGFFFQRTAMAEIAIVAKMIEMDNSVAESRLFCFSFEDEDSLADVVKFVSIVLAGVYWNVVAVNP
jgi:hypothetical protein